MPDALESIKLKEIRNTAWRTGENAVEWWWCIDESLITISKLLTYQRYVIIDHFLKISGFTYLFFYYRPYEILIFIYFYNK